MLKECIRLYVNCDCPPGHDITDLVTVYWLEEWPMSAVSLLMYQVSSARGLDSGSRQSAVIWSPSEYLDLTPSILGPV